METISKFILELLHSGTPAVVIILCAIIYWLFRCAEKKENSLTKMGESLQENTRVLDKLVTLVELLMHLRTEKDK